MHNSKSYVRTKTNDKSLTPNKVVTERLLVRSYILRVNLYFGKRGSRHPLEREFPFLEIYQNFYVKKTHNEEIRNGNQKLF